MRGDHGVAALLTPLRRGINNMLMRAVVRLVVDDSGLQVAQDETRDDCERLQQYGFTSVPLAGAAALLVFLGGNRAHPLITNIDDPRHRKRQMQPGEVALYTDQGDYVLLKRGRIVEIKAGTKVRVDAPLVECTGDLSVAGNLTVSGNANVSGTVTGTTDVIGGGKALKTHTHGGVMSGGAVTGPPS
jgi:phage baseplate assembly protein V